MEAEAQCAELVRISLVDGVVTDDSDVFLFGASKVYKNVFNQEKYVECYMSNDVERELSLDRERLIQLAYLLGSDYTTGFAGVGQVAAMEILKEFQGDSDEPDESPLEPLKRFKEWFETPTLPKNETSDFRKKLVSRSSRSRKVYDLYCYWSTQFTFQLDSERSLDTWTCHPTFQILTSERHI